MRKKLALALLVSLLVFAAPALSTATTAGTTPSTAASADLSVDDFLLAGAVTTELVSAVRCPVPTLACGSVNQDCGVVGNQCHCKSAPGTLVCVANP